MVTDPLNAPSLDFRRVLFVFLQKIAGMMEYYSYKITFISSTFWSELEILYHYTKFQLINAKPPFASFCKVL